MKNKCSNESCLKKIKPSEVFCSKCSKEREKIILKSLENYLSEDYLFEKNYFRDYPYKIVECQKLSKKLRITDYSAEFLRMFYGFSEPQLSICEINHSIERLKVNQTLLFEALKYLWVKPKPYLTCHKSTLYRRLHRALRFIAYDLGLLKSA